MKAPNFFMGASSSSPMGNPKKCLVAYQRGLGLGLGLGLPGLVTLTLNLTLTLTPTLTTPYQNVYWVFDGHNGE